MPAALSFSLQVTLGFGTNSKASEALNKACSSPVASSNPFASMTSSWFTSISTEEDDKLFVASASKVEMSVLGKGMPASLLAVLVPPAVIDACLEKYTSKSAAAPGSCFWIREEASVDSFTTELLARIHPLLVEWNVKIRGIILTSIAAQDNAPAEIVLLDIPSPKQSGGRSVTEILEVTNNGSVLNIHGDDDHLNTKVLKVLPLGQVQFQSGPRPSVASLKAPPLWIPTCAVCLHRIDPRRLGLPPPANQHLCSKFCSGEDCHKQRLLEPWNGTRCRACHVIQHYWTMTSTSSGKEEDDLFCGECAMHNTLWVCLTCGFVGCGRYSNKHSVAHFQETNHPFSLELATLRIWDYVHGDLGEYAHRVDLLECPSSDPLSQPWIARSRASRYPGEGGDGGGMDQPMYNNVMMGPVAEKSPKKATMIGEEYEALLQSALEDQAQHYEGEITRLRAELTSQLVDQNSITAEEQKGIDEVRSDIDRLHSEIDETSRLLLDAQAHEAGLRVTSQRLLREQQVGTELVKNIEDAARRENERGKMQVEDLEQQIRDLTANLRMRQQFSQSEELNKAQIYGTDAKPASSNNKRKGKKKGRKKR
jgi:hypothetical protein